jgi:hypothetical protein
MYYFTIVCYFVAVMYFFSAHGTDFSVYCHAAADDGKFGVGAILCETDCFQKLAEFDIFFPFTQFEFFHVVSFVLSLDAALSSRFAATI